MKLYNTLSRQPEEFRPLTPGEVKLYSCGPTVYDYAHIGNLRKFVFDDSLRRVLQLDGYKVKHVMNVTDVGHLVSDADEGDDKLEKGAARENKSVWNIANFYFEAFKRDVAELNILAPNVYPKNQGYPRATDFINEQVDLVKILLDKEFAYISPRAIYFDTSRLASYGKLTSQKLYDKQVGVREEVVTDRAKRHPQDFALWFFTVDRFKDHAMRWPSPWGEGFPGWHLECSAIIHTLLGDPIDIHTGGIDNLGTHHVNEMAQTEAAYGNQLANYWLHSEHIFVDDQKMSKSLGNIYTLTNIKQKGFEPLALRLLFYQGHYRSRLNFTWESLAAMQAVLKNFQAWADLAFQAYSSSKLVGHYKQALASFKTRLLDDLDTPGALAILNGMVSRVEELGIDSKAVHQAAQLVDEAFGLDLTRRSDVSAEQNKLIKAREAARTQKDWAKADQLRDQLTKAKLDILDTPQGPIWRRH